MLQYGGCVEVLKHQNNSEICSPENVCSWLLLKLDGFAAILAKQIFASDFW